MDRRQTTYEHCVIVVDENLFHAQATESALAKLNIQVVVYTSPVEALDFLKHHEQDVDFVLVAVHMKEMHGFRFLDISRGINKSLQVIMMSVETTWPIMQRCVDLAARFLVKKPANTNDICNIWQYLDQKQQRLERIKNLFKGIQGNTYGVDNSGKEGLEMTLPNDGEHIGKKALNLLWTPFLQNKFLHAIELLGDAATPKKVEVLMNIPSIERKQISSHLQKHRKRMQKELHNSVGSKKYRRNASNIDPLKTYETIAANNEIKPGDGFVEEMTNDQELIIKESLDNNFNEPTQKMLELGTIFGEQLSNDPLADKEEIGEASKSMMSGYVDEDNNTLQLVPESYNAENVKDLIN